MFKDILINQQPVVYKTLYNGLKNERLSHCYLFVGDKGTLKKETAFLLAQSLICSNTKDGFACEECLSCIRVKENNYADLIYLDGSLNTIKVDDINYLQNQFRKTALEVSGKKIFIINNCENMTIKASNSLLKFIEEPVGSITGIFITSNISNVLPTIISRCQTIHFKPLSKDIFFKKAKDMNIDDLNAHIISSLAYNSDDIQQISNNTAYSTSINYFVEFMNQFFQNKDFANFYLQNALNKKSTDKTSSKEIFTYFLQIGSIFANDINNNVIIDDESWTGLINKAVERKFDSIKFLKIVTECKDALKTNTNLLLLVDQFIYKQKEENL